jgi:DNA invertase Pin-like site-specific DNA recombinase
MNIKRIGLYIRVSTEEQAVEGYSISGQRERLKAFCVAQSWETIKFYVDEGISGRSTERPALKKLMKDIEDGLIDVLLVYRLDRLTRSVRDLHDILDFLEKHNCQFRSATEVYDTSTAMGRMFITIVAAIAEWESANLGERVRLGQIEKARQGEWSAPAPYGFRKNNQKRLEVNPDEIEAVKLMIRKVKEGYSFRQLSMYMQNTSYKPRRGYKWHIASLLDLLHNPVLYGAMQWNDEVYEGTHEGIMSKEEFMQLQNIIKSRQIQKKRETNYNFIYQTKIVCPSCGNRLSSECSRWKNKNGMERSAKYQRAWASDLISDTEFKNRMDDTRKRYSDLERQLNASQDETTFGNVNPEYIKQLSNEFNQNYEYLTDEEKRTFVQQFIESIELTEDATAASGKKVYDVKVVRFF